MSMSIKIFSVAKIAELSRSPQRRSRVTVQNQEMIVEKEMFLGVDRKQVGMERTECQLAVSSKGVMQRLERSVDRRLWAGTAAQAAAVMMRNEVGSDRVDALNASTCSASGVRGPLVRHFSQSLKTRVYTSTHLLSDGAGGAWQQQRGGHARRVSVAAAQNEGRRLRHHTALPTLQYDRVLRPDRRFTQRGGDIRRQHRHCHGTSCLHPSSDCQSSVGQ